MQTALPFPPQSVTRAGTLAGEKLLQAAAMGS